MVKKAKTEKIEDDELDRSVAPEQSPLDQETDLETAEKETGTTEIPTSEESAIHGDNETSAELNKKPVVKKTPEKKASARPARQPKKRSKKYLEAKSAVDLSKPYVLDEALEMLKTISYAKFDATVNLSVHLEKSKKAQEESLRGVIKLPNGTGKKLNVVIATDELIEKIKKEKIDFDVLISSPAMMVKLAQVAKILGPRGKMPNPKDGTVVDDPERTAQDLSENTTEYRADAGRNIHIAVGKISWEKAKLAANIEAVLKSLQHLKKTSVTLSTSMSPGIRVDIK